MGKAHNIMQYGLGSVLCRDFEVVTLFFMAFKLQYVPLGKAKPIEFYFGFLQSVIKDT